MKEVCDFKTLRELKKSILVSGDLIDISIMYCNELLNEEGDRGVSEGVRKELLEKIKEIEYNDSLIGCFNNYSKNLKNCGGYSGFVKNVWNLL